MPKFISGEIVLYQGKQYEVVKLLESLSDVLLKDVSSKKLSKASIKEISEIGPPLDEDDKIIDSEIIPLDALTEKQKETARFRYNVIEPIINSESGISVLVEEIAASRGIGVSTIYSWLQKFSYTSNITSLIDQEGRGGKGKNRIESNIEEVINNCIEKYYLKKRKSIKYTFQMVYNECKDLNLKVPHINTLRKRIKEKPAEEVLRYRKGRSAARNKFKERPYHYHAEYPLMTAQIDHTLLDIMLVDEKTRMPLKKPWITILIDVYSRMILGFYISFDAPGSYGTGRAIAHAILPKETYLAKMNVDTEWPCWGKMKTIHCDNAKEFKGKSLKKSALDYGINIVYRQVKVPEYGGHIERLMGTFATELIDLPGATKISKELRSEFVPEKNAAFTLNEFERWVTMFITHVYHKRIHSTISTTPQEKWLQGIRGDANTKGIGIPERFTDARRIMLDFMPLIYRTVQRQGVMIDNIHYHGEPLYKWINSIDPNVKSRTQIKRKFIFKQDPRDISRIYFLDPEIKTYFEIPYQNITGPPMSKWEFKHVVRDLKENGKEVNEHEIFSAYNKLREHTDASIKKTKLQKLRNERSSKKKIDDSIVQIENKPTKPSVIFKKDDDDIKPFEIDYGPFR
ncbi:MAG: Mu transposase C-terminal domain-containing protein [Chitinophagaceae bacterium]|nr:Mu transposase C-terminal domain-containing protein [Chitinophagaceae bacterium]